MRREREGANQLGVPVTSRRLLPADVTPRAYERLPLNRTYKLVSLWRRGEQSEPTEEGGRRASTTTRRQTRGNETFEGSGNEVNWIVSTI